MFFLACIFFEECLSLFPFKKEKQLRRKRILKLWMEISLYFDVTLKSYVQSTYVMYETYWNLYLNRITMWIIN